MCDTSLVRVQLYHFSQHVSLQSFGITDVIVTPFTTSGGEGKGPVTSGTVIDFGTDAGLKPWLGEDVTQESCNPKTMLTSSGGGGPEAFMQATFTGLADHNAVKVSLKYAFLQSAGKMKAQVGQVHKGAVDGVVLLVPLWLVPTSGFHSRLPGGLSW